MLITLVHIHVKPEFLEAFIEATLDNARNSVQEPGIARFDFIQQADDPTRFTLIEVYRDEDAPARHKETAHYNRWRETVADMMAEPRVGVRCSNIFPDDGSWG
ncbi:MAG: antibiotic biosynthesis monooxygenase [Chloroflexi bacterium]|jgi:quinol monooxygenase YgiN|nr:antibiotic biosynthesis monooxygenase [Chloroflexota bacterium]MDL1885203.1 antibiotic biosynthesis monooxygenase [Anaerolineae bacterium CFX8]